MATKKKQEAACAISLADLETYTEALSLQIEGALVSF
jgi:hypothetical protein